MRANPDSKYDCHSNATLSLGTRRGVAIVTPVHAGTIRFRPRPRTAGLVLDSRVLLRICRNCCCAHTRRVVRFRVSPIKMNPPRPLLTPPPPPQRQQKQHQQQRLDGIGGVVAKRRAGVVQAG